MINGGTTPTSTALATLGPDGAADYTFAITWEINGAALPALAAVEGSAHVHTGSIATVLPPGDQATLALVQAPASTRPSATIPTAGQGSARCGTARHQAELFVAASDVVKASDEDLSWLYPDRTPDETLEAWLALGPAIVALTRGPPDRSSSPATGAWRWLPNPSLWQIPWAPATPSWQGSSPDSPNSKRSGRRETSVADAEPGSAARTRRLRQPRRSDHVFPERCKSATLRGTRPTDRASSGHFIDWCAVGTSLG